MYVLNCCCTWCWLSKEAPPPHPVFVRSSVKTANWNAGWVTSPSVLHFHWPVCQAVAGTLCSVLVCLPKHTAVEEEKEGRDGLSNVYLLSWSWTVQRCKAWPWEGAVAFCPRGIIPRDFGVFLFFFFFSVSIFRGSGMLRNAVVVLILFSWPHACKERMCWKVLLTYLFNLI